MRGNPVLLAPWGPRRRRGGGQHRNCESGIGRRMAGEARNVQVNQAKYLERDNHDGTTSLSVSEVLPITWLGLRRDSVRG